MKAAAFFDVDGTLLAKNSGPLYLKFQLKEGKIGVAQLARGFWYFFQYKFGMLDWEKVSREMAAAVEGDSEEQMIADCNRWYDNDVKKYLRPELLEVMRKHQSAGEKAVLLTAATIYLAAPLGKHIGADDILCNRLEVEDGLFTGKMIDPTCYGEGKIKLAEKFALCNGIDLSQSIYYTDSITDMPMLERVGKRAIVNPDPVLRREAKKRGWPIIDYPPPPLPR